MPTSFTWTLEDSAAATTGEATEATPRPRNFALDEDGDLDIGTTIAFVSGQEAIQQSLLCRLRAFQGEWFLDETLGLPYFQEILGRSPNLVAIRALYRAALESTPGVLEVKELRLALKTDRTLVVAFKVSTDVGELVADTTIEGTP
jgi:hypothetical protein